MMESGISFRSALGLMLSACWLTAGCSGNGGGDGEQTIKLRLANESTCYGIEIEVDESGLSAADSGTPQSCRPTTEILALGCEVETSIVADQYRLATHGCFAPPNTPLFECDVPNVLASRFRDDSEMRCGCGCQAACPSDASVLVCDEDGTKCAAGPTQATVSGSASGPSSVQSDAGVAQETTVASSTTYCGTCCDAGVHPGVALASSESIREIRFTISLDSGECHDFDCDVAPAMDGPVTYRNEVGSDRVEVCLSSKDAVVGPTDLLYCEAFTGGDSLLLIENVSAVDERLRPISPQPVVVNNPYD